MILTESRRAGWFFVDIGGGDVPVSDGRVYEFIKRVTKVGINQKLGSAAVRLMVPISQWRVGVLQGLWDVRVSPDEMVDRGGCRGKSKGILLCGLDGTQRVAG